MANLSSAQSKGKSANPGAALPASDSGSGATSAASIGDTASWLEGLHQQHALFLRLAELSSLQMKHIEADDIDGLNSVLAQRQQMISQLQNVTARYAGIVAGVDRAAMQSKQREEIEQLMASIDELRAGISDMDDRAQQRLSVAHQSLGGELKQLSQSGKARNAYAGQYQAAAAAPIAASRFTDQRG